MTSGRIRLSSLPARSHSRSQAAFKARRVRLPAKPSSGTLYNPFFLNGLAEHTSPHMGLVSQLNFQGLGDQFRMDRHFCCNHGVGSIVRLGSIFALQSDLTKAMQWKIWFKRLKYAANHPRKNPVAFRHDCPVFAGSRKFCCSTFCCEKHFLNGWDADAYGVRYIRPTIKPAMKSALSLGFLTTPTANTLCILM